MLNHPFMVLLSLFIISMWTKVMFFLFFFSYSSLHLFLLQIEMVSLAQSHTIYSNNLLLEPLQETNAYKTFGVMCMSLILLEEKCREF